MKQRCYHTNNYKHKFEWKTGTAWRVRKHIKAKQFQSVNTFTPFSSQFEAVLVAVKAVNRCFSHSPFQFASVKLSLTESSHSHFRENNHTSRYSFHFNYYQIINIYPVYHAKSKSNHCFFFTCLCLSIIAHMGVNPLVLVLIFKFQCFVLQLDFSCDGNCYHDLIIFVYNLL
jgi:hypothetical protein